MRLFAAMLLLSGTAAMAGDGSAEFPLEGHAILGGAGLIDPDPAEADDTHMHIVMTGEAARAFYDALDVVPEHDACTDGMIKAAPTGVTCLAFPGGAVECFFAIDLRDATLTAAGIVC